MREALQLLKEQFVEMVNEDQRIAFFYAQNSERIVSITVGSHGDEVGGFAALGEFLRECVVAGYFQRRWPRTSFLVGLGNLEAALQNRRYVERDLDRSFGTPSTQFLEERIAKIYEKWFAWTQWNLDVHQTVLPSRSPFFIGPAAARVRSMAMQIHPEIPVIGFPAGGFSVDGTPLDDWILYQGNVSVSVEMGQKGFHEEQIRFGKNLMFRFLDEAVRGFSQTLSQSPRILEKKAVVRKTPGLVLHPGFENLQSIRKGEVLGISQGGDSLLAPESGFVLFPKYGELAACSSELCQIVGPVDAMPAVYRSSAIFSEALS